MAIAALFFQTIVLAGTIIWRHGRLESLITEVARKEAQHSANNVKTLVEFLNADIVEFKGQVRDDQKENERRLLELEKTKAHGLPDR